MIKKEIRYKCIEDNSKSYSPPNCNREPIRKEDLLAIVYNGRITRYVCPYCRGNVEIIKETDSYGDPNFDAEGKFKHGL